MESEDDSHLLQALALGKNVNLEQWPSLLPRLINRLKKIILHEFPRPVNPTPPMSGVTSSSQAHSNSETDQKQSEEDVQENSGISSLPPILRSLFSSIHDTLLKYFCNAPPHTIQRLAELLLFPRSNYRSLSSYLHALDRVVHVTSPITTFPLPFVHPDSTTATILSNGGITIEADSHSLSRGYSIPSNPLIYSVGSDETLGGAPLTPITWLTKSRSNSPLEGEVITQRSTDIIEGPNGPGGVETVSVSINGVSSATIQSIGSADVSYFLGSQDKIIREEIRQKDQDVDDVLASQIRDENKNITNGNVDQIEILHAKESKETRPSGIVPQLERSPEAVVTDMDKDSTVETRRFQSNDDEIISKSIDCKEPQEVPYANSETSKQKSKESDNFLPSKRQASHDIDAKAEVKRNKKDTEDKDFHQKSFTEEDRFKNSTDSQIDKDNPENREDQIVPENPVD